MASVKFRPQNDFVLLEESLPEPYHVYKQYEHVIAPQAFEHGPEDRPLYGTVLAKGESCIRSSIAVGMIAIVGKWSGARFSRDGCQYVLVKESDILATIE